MIDYTSILIAVFNLAIGYVAYTEEPKGWLWRINLGVFAVLMVLSILQYYK